MGWLDEQNLFNCTKELIISLFTACNRADV